MGPPLRLHGFQMLRRSTRNVDPEWSWGFVMAFRSFSFHLIFRVLLISVAFAAGFGAIDASAQQPPAQTAPADPKPAGGFIERFIGNFFNGSQDIPDSPWPYNSG